jgi:hypothetical protein
MAVPGHRCRRYGARLARVTSCCEVNRDGIWGRDREITGALSFRHAAAELALALAPIAAMPAGTQRAAAVRWVDPIADGILHHGKQRFREAPLLGSDPIALLHHVHDLGLGHGVEAAEQGRAIDCRRDVAPGIFSADVNL